jgi:hypothetical protein
MLTHARQVNRVCLEREPTVRDRDVEKTTRTEYAADLCDRESQVLHVLQHFDCRYGIERGSRKGHGGRRHDLDAHVAYVAPFRLRNQILKTLRLDVDCDYVGK